MVDFGESDKMIRLSGKVIESISEVLYHIYQPLRSVRI